MQTRAGVTAFVLAAGIPLVGCYGLAPEDICAPSPRVKFDSGSTLTTLAVGETRLIAATVPPHIGDPCGYEYRPFTRIWWTDSDSRNDNEPKVQIHLLTCTSCTLLYEDGRSARRGVAANGMALIDGSGGTQVVLEVKGLAPGEAELRLAACVDDLCLTSAEARTLLRVE